MVQRIGSHMATRARPGSKMIAAAVEYLASAEGPRELWYRAWGPVSEFWVVTDPIDLPAERHIRLMGLELFDAFPEAQIKFHVLNPRLMGDDDPRELVPGGAEHYPIH